MDEYKYRQMVSKIAEYTYKLAVQMNVPAGIIHHDVETIMKSKGYK